jgi:hypothetical protein
MSDQYENWRARLEAQARGERLASTTEPDPGFYKRRMIKNGPFVPVWIYPRVDGKPWLARRTEGPGRVVEIDAYKEWERCYGRAITKEEYLQVVGGGEWFGVDSIVGEQSREDAEAVRSGSNQPADEAEVLKDQISHALAGVGKYAKLKGWTKRKKVDVPVVDSLIKSDEDLAHAQSMRARLNELAREADEKFHKEKDPITKQGKAVDERWRFRQDAENAALVIREAMAAYETKKLEAAQAVAQEPAEEEISFTRALEAPPPSPQPAPPLPVQTTVKGGHGRAATIGSRWDVTEIVDQDKFYQWARVHPEVQKFLLDLAQRAVDVGRDPPGITRKLRATVS